MARFGKGGGAPRGNRNAAGKGASGFSRMMKGTGKYMAGVGAGMGAGAYSGGVLGAHHGVFASIPAGPAGFLTSVGVGALTGSVLGGASVLAGSKLSKRFSKKGK